jgi:hypothetical protein
VAVLNAKDRHYEICTAIRGRVPPRAGAGELIVEANASQDLARMAASRSHADFPRGTADASVIAVAECLDTTRVATTHPRHFHAITPAPRRLRPTARALSFEGRRMAVIGQDWR